MQKHIEAQPEVDKEQSKQEEVIEVKPMSNLAKENHKKWRKVLGRQDYALGFKEKKDKVR